MKVATAITATLATLFGSLLGFTLFLGNHPGSAVAGQCVPESNDAPAVDLDDEQLANAETIVRVGRSRNVPPYGLVISLAAAMQESGLRNLSYGDRDSAGIFQMRPSMGWGTVEQITDPVYAATAFFGGPDVAPENAGLLDIAGWERMAVAEAAQAVERSGFPGAYAKWAPAASAIVEKLTNAELDCPTGMSADCPPTGRSVEAGLQPDGARVVRCAVARFHIASIGGRATAGHVQGSDHYTGRAVDLMIQDWATPAGRQFGDSVASFFIANAGKFGVTYIIWRARIWNTERPYWRPYTHPSGVSSPTLLHLDHLHISVSGNGASTATTKETAS